MASPSRKRAEPGASQIGRASAVAAGRLMPEVSPAGGAANVRSMTSSVRLRQAVLAAPRLAPIAERLTQELRLPEPFHDPGVKEFGLENAVFPVGDTFLEVVAPIAENTAAGRYLARHGEPEAAGYMAIFQFADLAAARKRVADLGVRIVWQADLDDIAGTHLHPADVPGAIVSLDWADPPESWHWAGPRWRGGAPDNREPGGIDGITVAVDEPGPVGERWLAILGGDPGVRFVPAAGVDGIVEVRLRRPGRAKTFEVGTVRFVVETVEEA